MAFKILKPEGEGGALPQLRLEDFSPAPAPNGGAWGNAKAIEASSKLPGSLNFTSQGHNRAK